MAKMTFRVYRTSTFIFGHRPENDLSYIDLRKRIDGRCSLENWFIDFNDDSELVSFMVKYWPTILKPPTYENTVGDLEIYDSDRETIGVDTIVN
jgi:hypothetical protein